MGFTVSDKDDQIQVTYQITERSSLQYEITKIEIYSDYFGCMKEINYNDLSIKEQSRAEKLVQNDLSKDMFIEYSKYEYGWV